MCGAAVGAFEEEGHGCSFAFFGCFGEEFRGAVEGACYELDARVGVVGGGGGVVGDGEGVHVREAEGGGAVGEGAGEVDVLAWVEGFLVPGSGNCEGEVNEVCGWEGS